MTRPRVVLAEDHPTMARELHRLLATEYDVVDIVENGRALIDTVRRLVPDVVVCDIAMPVLNGLAAAVAILAEQPECRMVFVTVQDHRAVITQALECGALGYVVKCEAGDELEAAMQSAMQGNRYLSATARFALSRGIPCDPDEGRRTDPALTIPGLATGAVSSRARPT